MDYDPTRDNRELTTIVQSARQQQQELQQAREPKREDLELPTPQPSPEPVENQPLPERKPQPVWSPQYGIPAIEDLIKAIPEHSKEPQATTPSLAHGQREEAQANYQQWARHARAIYQVVEPQDIDQRIAFLMQSRQQSSNQITQVLAQSPAVQELRRRDFSYVQSYSKFCQSQAGANQSTWQQSLDQYLRAVEIERQLMEQQRLASERQRTEQQERQHNLKLLEQWQEAAIALGKPASYVERILEVTASYQRGLPLSEKTIEARQQDLAAYQLKLQAQRQQQERGRGFSR